MDYKELIECLSKREEPKYIYVQYIDGIKGTLNSTVLGLIDKEVLNHHNTVIKSITFV